jgi:hypothetical protein
VIEIATHTREEDLKGGHAAPLTLLEACWEDLLVNTVISPSYRYGEISFSPLRRDLLLFNTRRSPSQHYGKIPYSTLRRDPLLNTTERSPSSLSAQAPRFEPVHFNFPLLKGEYHLLNININYFFTSMTCWDAEVCSLNILWDQEVYYILPSIHDWVELCLIDCYHKLKIDILWC